MAESVLVQRDGGVAIVTLNRPDVLNALDADTAEALRDAAYDLEADGDVRCVVIRGAGRGFMAGGDIAWFRSHADTLERSIGAMMDQYHTAVRVLHRMAKPVIGQLHGPVAGAGMSLALSVDLAIAAEDTVFAIGYANLGTSPDGGATWFLPRLVGRRKALEIALLGDRIGAEDAGRLGLVNRVVPAAELEAETMTLARRLADGPTLAHGAAKRLIGQAFDTDLDAQLEAERSAFMGATRTADFREGIDAFAAKRKPDFRGT